MTEAESYLRELAGRGYRQGDGARFEATWKRLETDYFARLALVIEPFSDWRDRFRAAATETALLVEAFPREARFLAVDALAAGEAARECRRRLATRLVELLETVRSDLPDPDAVPASTGAWIVAIFFDRVYRRCTQAEGPDLPSQLPELMFLAVSAYFGTEAGLEELVRQA